MMTDSISSVLSNSPNANPLTLVPIGWVIKLQLDSTSQLQGVCVCVSSIPTTLRQLTVVISAHVTNALNDDWTFTFC